MHLTQQSRQSVTSFCSNKIFHHLLVEFNCDDKDVEANIRETSQFYQNFDKQMNWTYVCREKVKKCSQTYEPCTMPSEGPLITVHNSENPSVHSVTARGIQGLLQTSILGVLSSPVIKQHLYYISRHGESDYNVLGRIGGDADLSARGNCYAERLTKYFATTPGVVKPKMVCVCVCVCAAFLLCVVLVHFPFSSKNQIASEFLGKNSQRSKCKAISQR